MKHILAFFILSLSLQGVTILIDPGHGGDDVGAVGTYTIVQNKKKRQKSVYEKDLTLAIAKRVHKLLSADHNVYLTRSIDRSISLEARSLMAETVKADLFISIHANASFKKDSTGFETYFLSNHDDAAVKKVEGVENKGLDEEKWIVQKILIDLVIEKTVERSKSLADQIHGEVNKVLGKEFSMKDRGVRPGLFYVLALSKRPSVLLEIGFMSNQAELKRISEPKVQERYAQSIYRGIKKYISKYHPKGPSLF